MSTPGYVRVETKVEWLVDVGARINTVDSSHRDVGIHVISSQGAAVSLYMARAAFARVLFRDWRSPKAKRPSGAK